MNLFSRRTFLRTGAALVLGAVAAACKKGAGLVAPTGSASGDSFDALLAGRQQTMSVLIPGFETLSGTEQRLVVALFGLGNEGEQLTGGTGRLWLAPGRAARALGPYPLTFRGEGLDGRGVYVATVTFPADGSWNALVEAAPSGAPGSLVGVAEVVVGRRHAMPKPGDRAVSVATPTVRAHAGVEPYCTRKPPCTMHGVSLADALRNGKPTVLIIATPAFCESRLCGPEVDLVQEAATEVGARANFVHIEVYKNDDSDTIARKSPLAPAAVAWRLEEEPVIYWIGADGTIARRYIGPVDRNEVREATSALVA